MSTATSMMLWLMDLPTWFLESTQSGRMPIRGALRYGL